MNKDKQLQEFLSLHLGLENRYPITLWPADFKKGERPDYLFTDNLGFYLFEFFRKQKAVEFAEGIWVRVPSIILGIIPEPIIVKGEKWYKVWTSEHGEPLIILH